MFISIYDLIFSICRSVWYFVGRCMINICERKDVNRKGWRDGRKKGDSFGLVLLRKFF